MFVGSIAPKLLGVDMRASARELELELGIANEDDEFIRVPYTRIVARAHRVVEGAAAAGSMLADIEQLHPTMSIERVVRGQQILPREPALVVQPDDVLA